MTSTTQWRPDRESATTWASWFRALGDPTRVLIMQLLASADKPLSVGEITEVLDVGQSTVSHHLAKLADVGFVHVEGRGTSTLWRVNQACVHAFPAAAQAVLGAFSSNLPQEHR